MDLPEHNHPDVIAPPPLIFGIFATAGLVGHFLVADRLMRFGASLAVGIGLAISAGGLALWARRALKAGGTNIRPDRPVLSVVKGGPFEYTRNPMYVSLCLLQVAIGFLVNGWVPLLSTIPTAAVLHFGAILPEERYLEEKFGPAYLEYKQRVRRWI